MSLDLEKMFDQCKKLAAQPQICGLVFRIELKNAFLGKPPQGFIQSEAAVSWHSVPVFFDEQQTEDLLVFENQELMYAYLNRKENPYGWIYARAKAMSKDDGDLRLFKPLEPRVPKHPRYTNPWLGLF
ncbi:hypothetical protein [Nostoc sp. FACHB-110]|uniref:hypothetical protein n=1 Tax=Nostoc sp. FACHB-110 TaxID=2692834 RepID=UPI001685A0D2|nr:hypothetical protein [Nostoc sp. FACHB-110]MBD2437362.1 hypothetical protein [Nostoc sp. FACHB-110]